MKQEYGVRICVVLLVLFCGVQARASFHTWDISEVYSNSDGSVQFIELVNGNSNGQDEFAGRTITSNSNSFTFPSALSVGNATANLRLIIATPAYGSAFGSVLADYNTLPANFFDPLGDTINFAGVDTVTFSGAPTNGIDSLNYTGSNGSGLSVASNSPTNLNSQVGALVPEPNTALLMLIGALTLGGLRKKR